MLSELWEEIMEEGRVWHLFKPANPVPGFAEDDEGRVLICPFLSGKRRVSQRSCVDSRCASGDIMDDFLI